MKTFAILAAAVLALALAGAPQALAAESHAHGHDGHGQPALQLDHGKKWGTDAALRQGMGRIRAAIEARHEGIHANALGAAEYRALGQAIEKQVAYIVANCKLPPEADANLHIVVAELVAAADALQGKGGAKPREGALRAVAALNDYGRFFDDPGFKPLA